VAKAVGIGGVFFRAADRKALAEWYATHLGVPEIWQQEGGMTVFAPFRQESDYFPIENQWMVNFRVDDLDALKARLEAAGIAVETRPEEWDTPETGRFARIAAPAGDRQEPRFRACGHGVRTRRGP
jgi:predicted enzyme related to lactoylglutathione lyase